MPEVRVQYNAHENARLDPLTPVVARNTILEIAPKLFAVPGRGLSAADFSVYAEAVDEPSRQTHDVIVRFTVHHDPERLQFPGGPDGLAKELAKALATELTPRAVYGNYRPPSVGVSLVLAEIGWATAD